VPGVEVWAQGQGLLQICRAWDYLHSYSAFPDEDLM
jgi:hypothetical protein